jgi:hypothetical protein
MAKQQRRYGRAGDQHRQQRQLDRLDPTTGDRRPDQRPERLRPELPLKLDETPSWCRLLGRRWEGPSAMGA